MKTICLIFVAIFFAEISSAEINTGIANPASVNCINKGGRLEIRKGPGGESGYCIFPDGTECEEWGLFRGEKCREKQINPKSGWVQFNDYSRLIGVWINEKFVNTLKKTNSVPNSNKDVNYSLVNISKNNIYEMFNFHESLEHPVEKIEYNPAENKIKISSTHTIILNTKDDNKIEIISNKNFKGEFIKLDLKLEKDQNNIYQKVGYYLQNIIFGGTFKDKSGNTIIINEGTLQINKKKSAAYLELDTTSSEVTCLFDPFTKDSNGYPVRYAVEYKKNVLKLFNVTYLGAELIKKGKLLFQASKIE